jgi:hypothetical protein
VITFLSPLFLAGALVAAVPVLLHLLKREPETRLQFSAVKLLRGAPVEHSQRQYLRDLLLLALRVAALLLLALAFARPFFRSAAYGATSGITVVAIDTSLSMSAGRQFERAKQLAKEAVDRAPASDVVGIVTFADQAAVALQPVADRTMAKSAVEAATTGFGATSYRAALATAADMVSARGGDRSTIVVVTDLQESGWDAGDRITVPESARIEVLDVGAPPPNLAVTALRATPDRVVATVRNAGPRARDARVELTVDGRLAGEAGAAIGPNQTAEVTLPGARGGSAAVSVSDGDGVLGDNARYVVLEDTGRPSVLVVTASGDVSREAFYVQHALTAPGPGGPAYQVAGVGASQLGTWDSTRLARHAAILLLSTRGLERRGRELLAEYLQKGGGLLMAAGPKVDGVVAADVLGGRISLTGSAAAVEGAPESVTRTLAPADTRHPVFRAFSAGGATLGLVKVQRVTMIGAAGCQTLARLTTGEAALVDCAPGKGRALVFASDFDNEWNDFPLHSAFVPFLHESVRYLAGGARPAGEYLVAAAPAGVPAKPGIATLAQPVDAGGTARRVAINVDPAESEQGRLSAEEFQTAVTRLKDVSRSAPLLEASQQEEHQHIWQYVLGVMIATMIVETFVAARMGRRRMRESQ